RLRPEPVEARRGGRRAREAEWRGRQSFRSFDRRHPQPGRSPAGGAASLPRPRPEGPASTTTPITVAPPAGARASPTPRVAPPPGTQVPAGPHVAAGTV